MRDHRSVEVLQLPEPRSEATLIFTLMGIELNCQSDRPDGLTPTICRGKNIRKLQMTIRITRVEP